MIRLAMISVAIVICWFQPDHWIILDDSLALDAGAMYGILYQRIVQIAVFACISVLFLLMEFLGFRRRKSTYNPNAESANRGQKYPYILPIAPILGCIAIKALGGSIDRLAAYTIILAIFSLVVLFKLARQSVSYGNKAIGELLTVAVGTPLTLSVLF